MNTSQSTDPTVLVFMGLLGVMLLYVCFKLFRWLREYWIYVKAKPMRVLYLPFQIVFLPLRLLGAFRGKGADIGAGNPARGGQTSNTSIVAVTNNGGGFQVRFYDGSYTNLPVRARDYQLVGYTSETVSVRKVTGNIHLTMVYKFHNCRLISSPSFV